MLDGPDFFAGGFAPISQRPGADDMIAYQKPLYHWNYYASLEKDIVDLSRYIQFDEANFGT
jgi:hypothetical protein